MSLLIYRLLSSKYLSRWLVMANDLLFSIVSSFIAVLLTGFIFLRNFTVSQFALLGLFSLLSSFLSFYFLGIYKGVIRHSSFSETGRIGLAAIVKVLLLIGSAFFFFDYPFSKFL
ncbi:MAG: hypothetical protein PHT93_14880, partial [Massilibacteroides sp.]|nr:hypothetical protein [Massilibacteroides sp.]